MESGERSTTYFLRLEKSRQITNTISCLKSNTNKIYDTDKGILDQCTSFYDSLYSSRNPSDRDMHTFFHDLGEVNQLDDMK